MEKIYILLIVVIWGIIIVSLVAYYLKVISVKDRIINTQKETIELLREELSLTKTKNTMLTRRIFSLIEGIDPKTLITTESCLVYFQYKAVKDKEDFMTFGTRTGKGTRYLLIC